MVSLTCKIKNKQTELLETESRKVVARDWEVGGKQVEVSNRVQTFSYIMNKVLMYTMVTILTTLYCYLLFLKVHLIYNFMLISDI